MSRVKNISGGPLDVPSLGRVVEDGETVEVPDAHAPPSEDPDDNSWRLTWPPNRWEPVTGQAPKAITRADDMSGEAASA